MIGIQILLVIAVLYILARFLSTPNTTQTQAWKKILLVLIGLTSVVLIISPYLLDGIAHVLGVGRGADLLLYALTVAFVFGQLNTYNKSKEEHRKIVTLARKLAIFEAQIDERLK